MTNLGQIGIVLCGCSAIWLVGRPEDWSRWGYVVGLLGQPFWIWQALEDKRWGVLLVSLFYAYAWGQGAWTHLVQPWLRSR